MSSTGEPSCGSLPADTSFGSHDVHSSCTDAAAACDGDGASAIAERGVWGLESERIFRPYEPAPPPRSMEDIPATLRIIRTSVRVGSREDWWRLGDLPAGYFGPGTPNIPRIEDRDVERVPYGPPKLPIEPGEDLNHRISIFIRTVVWNTNTAVKVSFPIMSLTAPGLAGFTLFQLMICSSHNLGQIRVRGRGREGRRGGEEETALLHIPRTLPSAGESGAYSYGGRDV